MENNCIYNNWTDQTVNFLDCKILYLDINIQNRVKQLKMMDDDVN